MKVIKYFLQAIIIYIFFIIIKIIGLKNSRLLFSWIFNKLGPLVRKKDIINSNLKKMDPNLNDLDRKKIYNNMWSNYGKTFVEYLYLNKFRNKKFDTPQINIVGENILEDLIKNKKPAIFVSGHFANFELMSMELTRKNIKLATIYRPLNNFFLNPIMEYLRKKYVCKNQIKKGSIGMRNVINYIKNNYSIALMIDQRVSEGEKVPFFNYDALTTTLPAQIALKYKYDIIPIYIRRNSKNLFEIEIYNSITIKDKEDNEKNKIEITKDLNKILEGMILKDPGQWIWTHNRWK